jgi:hypothetical protein
VIALLGGLLSLPQTNRAANRGEGIDNGSNGR